MMRVKINGWLRLWVILSLTIHSSPVQGQSILSGPSSKAANPLPTQLKNSDGHNLDDNLEWISQIGGNAYAVAVSGNYAYVGIGPRLLILNIAVPSSPILVSQSTVWSGIVHGVAISGIYAYLAVGNSLKVVNISVPANPTEEGSLVLPDMAYGVAISGSYAYVADSYGGLRVVSIAAPGSPSEVGYLVTTAAAMDVAVNGSYAYLADSSEGLLVIDISIASTPIEVGHSAMDYEAVGIAFFTITTNKYVCIASMDGGLRIYRVNTPTLPTFLGSYITPGNTYDVVTNGNYAYVAAGDSGLQVIRISSPASPTRVGFLDTPGNAAGIFFSSNIAYVADSYAGLRIINVNLPGTPIELGAYDMVGDVQHIALAGNDAYLATGPGRLRIVDLTNPASPIKKGQYIDEGFAVRLAVQGNYTYIAEPSGLRVIDTTDPANPIQAGFVDTLGMLNNVTVSGSYAYSGQSIMTGMQVFNISNPSTPTAYPFFSIPGHEIMDVAVAGSYAYLANTDNGLRIINISNPRSLTETGYILTAYACSVAISGNYAYVANQGTGLSVINIADPAHPALISSLPLPGLSTWIVVSGNYAYIAAAESGVQVVDITNPAIPILAATYDTPGSAEGIAVAGQYGYIADREGGLEVLRFNQTGPTYTISGQVNNGLGIPIPGVTISAGPGISTTTDSSGNYTLVNLSASTYTLTPSKSGYIFEPVSRTVTVPPSATGQNFTSLNHAPVLFTPAYPTLASILEDTPPASNMGTLISTVIASVLPIDLVTDDDTGASEGIAVISADNTHGAWQYSLDNGATWSDLGSPTLSASRLLASDTLTRLRFLPASHFYGSANITLRAWDRTSGSNGGTADTTINGGTTAFSVATSTATITINRLNNPPVAYDQSVSTTKNTPIPITLTASDPDGDTLTYTVVTNSSHGTLTGAAPDLTYTPTAGYAGSDSFTFKANDGAADSNIATVSITVTNRPPVAQDQSVSTTKNTPIPITLTASDPDGDTLTYTVVTNSSHGTLTGAAPDLTYTPTAGYSGPDSFTFKANDGAADSNIATVSISITNRPPVAQDQSTSTTKNTPKAIILTASDPDGDILTYTVVTSPSHGTLTGAAPNLTYTPAAGYAGPDSFTFKANDGAADSNIATVSTIVTNRPPVAQDQSVSTTKNTPKAITLTASDPDGDALTYSVVTNPSHGTLTGAAPDLTYTPAAGYAGPDSFTFKANDGAADSNIATVSITVTNRLPVTYDQSVSTTKNTPKAIILTASDPDGDILTYTVVTSPSHGTLTGAAPNLTYTPTAGYAGPDSFTFKANDGAADSNIATVSITVTNRPPAAQDQSVSTTKNTPKSIILLATDPDGDPLAYTVVSPPSHGSLSGTAPNLTYTPTSGYYGPDSFTFKANDGTVDSNLATVSITVTQVNNPPVAYDQSVSTTKNTPIAITLTASDPDGDALTYTIATNPSHGTLTGAAPNLTYTPAAGYAGPDSFTFKANDGAADSNIATISITIANHPPVVSTFSVQVLQKTPFTFTDILFRNDFTDADAGDQLVKVKITSLPVHGILKLGGSPVTIDQEISVEDLILLVYYPDISYFDAFGWNGSDGTDYALVPAQVNIEMFGRFFLPYISK
jgi:hypothetical protein